MTDLPANQATLGDVDIAERADTGGELARRLTALWNPRPQVITLTDDEDLYEDDGCTGSGGCGCSSCHHDQHVRTAWCSFIACDKPTQFRLRAWRPGGCWQVQASDIGRAENPDEWVGFGDGQVFMIGSERYACGKPHAHGLWQLLLDRYNKGLDAEDPNRWRVQIETWRYRPDEFDLPHGDLPWLRELVGALKYNVRRLIDAVYPHAAHRIQDASSTLAGARRTAAQIVELLASLDTRDIPQVRYTDSIPPDVESVTTAPAGQQPNYFGRRFPVTPDSGWSCMALEVVYESDAALLAAYPDGLYERQRSELVLPTPDDQEAG